MNDAQATPDDAAHPIPPDERRHLRDVALAAARAGARIVRRHALDDRGRSALAWEAKGPADFVSRVDREAELALAAVIGEQRPDATLLGEELSPDAPVGDGIVFVADPLDGTTNFLHRFPWYATSVGVTVDGALVAGAIVNAATGETFAGAAGLGAARIHDDESAEPLAVSTIGDPSRALVGTGFPFKHVPHVEPYLRQFAAIAATTAGMRRAGSAALDLADVACGRFEGFWELGLAPWDVAAGILLVREAGGRVTDFGGHDVAVAHTPILATNAALGDWLRTTLGDALGEDRSAFARG